MGLQDEFIAAVEKSNNKIDVLKKYASMVSDADINEDLVIDIKMCNIYVEYATNQLIMANKRYNDKMSAYIILYHPKLFELLCHNKSMADVINFKNIMIHNIDEIYKNNIKDDKYDLCMDMLSVNMSKDRLNAIEYCYFLTWATYNKEWVGVDEKYVKDNNKNDILCVNITYNLKNLDSIVIYNNVIDDKIPVLTEEKINNMTRYRYITPKDKATTPVSIYDNNFKPIKKLSTDYVTILLDYGNSYYTKCFCFNNTEAPLKFANDVYEGKVKCNVNRILLFNTVNKDLFKHLPPQCYQEKGDKKELMKQYNTMKAIAMDSYHDSPDVCINKIISHPEIPKIINNNEKPFFDVYIKFLKYSEYYDKNYVINYCCDYIFENIFENKSLLNMS